MSSKYIIEDRHLINPKKRAKDIIAFCPKHHDINTPNLIVNLNRQMFKCFACGWGGSAFDYLDFIGEIAPKIKKDARGRPPIKPNDEIVKKCHSNLLEDKEITKKLKELRLWDLKTIKKFKLGMMKDKRITIPIYSRLNNIVNIRIYDFQHKLKGAKFISWAKGLGKRVDLFPAKVIEDHDEIILFEGEPDAILAQQLGLENATAFTAGVKTIKEEHLSIFIGKSIIVIFDIDDEGKLAASKMTRFLARLCTSVKNIHLPIDKPSNADFTDWIKTSGNITELKKLIKDTDPYRIEVKDRRVIANMKATELQLDEAGMAVNTQIKQKIKALVSGKDLLPYLIPKKLILKCLAASQKKGCIICGLNTESNEYEINFGPYDPEILQIVGYTKDSARGVYKRMAGIPKFCTTWDIEITETQNVEDLVLIPEFDNDEIGKPYINRRALLIGENIETNRPYIFTGWTAPDPKTHHIVHLMAKAKPTETGIQSFKVTEEIKEQLKIFQPEKDQSVMKKINEIHLDLSENITHIWGRLDLLMAIDLVFNSVLNFNFQGVAVRRGWTEGLIIGDTRTGKTETSIRMTQHYKAGELVGAENMSFAGLVGGLLDVSGRRMISWGKLPLNDGRAVILDEVDGMSIDEIAKLSAIRSGGVAEITKIQTEKTRARCRILMMGNPRKHILSSYGMGVLAIKELIGKPEDIARFDFALTVANDEVPIKEINKKRRNKIDHIYTDKLCSLRTRWIWSRKINQIKITETATDLILHLAGVMAKKYHSGIPLVQPSEQRIKLARMSIAIAGTVFSTKTGNEILVEDEHVETAFNVICKFFKKRSMSYDYYSEAQFREQTIVDSEYVKVRIATLGIEAIIDLYGKKYIQLSDFEDWTGERSEAKQLVSALMKNRCLKKPYSVYIKTEPFIQLLIDMKDEFLKDEKYLDNLKGEENEETDSGDPQLSL